MTNKPATAFNNRLIQKGKLFFWLGSLMVTSALTWFFGIAPDGGISSDALAVPATFLGLAIMLVISFRDCHFRQQ